MSQFDYQRSCELAAADYPFYSLIMAAMRQADTFNLAKLKQMFPQTRAELEARYNAVGGRLIMAEEDGDGAVHVPPAGG
jgi:hypothetical protein